VVSVPSTIFFSQSNVDNKTINTKMVRINFNFVFQLGII
jgi:hypothetical protein